MSRGPSARLYVYGFPLRIVLERAKKLAISRRVAHSLDGQPEGGPDGVLSSASRAHAL